MTIQRQYSLPNCTLILEGLGDLSSFNSTDVRPLMTVLINAECHLPGQDKPLTGGRDFLESLTNAVNRYAQEVLHGTQNFHYPQESTALVQLQRLDSNRHRLSVLPEGATPGSGIAAQLTRQVDLTTVQLFDLVEAVDQFFADAQTLPDLGLNVKPLSKRYFRNTEAIAKQSVPLGIGVSGLAVASLALFALPVPKINQPNCLQQSQPGCTAAAPSQQASPSPTLPPTTNGSPTSSPTSSPSPSPTTTTGAVASPSPSTVATTTPDSAELETVLNSSPEITDAKELESLREKLRQQIDQAWKTRTPVTQDLVYRVGVDKDGAIAGYKPVNPAAVTSVKQTPLLDLLKLPPNGGTRSSTDPLAQYKVVFTSSGVVEVAPWNQVMAAPVNNNRSGTEITDNASLEAMLPKIRSQIVTNWQSDPGFTKDLIFRVRVKSDGSIIDYKPDNQPAYDAVQETPLPKVGKPADEGGGTLQEPHAVFKVVFTPKGTVELSPWRGWQPE